MTALEVRVTVAHGTVPRWGRRYLAKKIGYVVSLVAAPGFAAEATLAVSNNPAISRPVTASAVVDIDLRVLHAELVRALRLSSAATEEVAAREQAEWNAACSAAGGGRPAVDLQDRTVIVVDDGIATGSKLGRAGR